VPKKMQGLETAEEFEKNKKIPKGSRSDENKNAERSLTKNRCSGTGPKNFQGSQDCKGAVVGRPLSQKPGDSALKRGGANGEGS